MVLKGLKTGVIFLLLVIFMFNCSSSKKTIRDETPDKETPKFDESFDPLKLNDEKIEFKEEPEKPTDQQTVFPIEDNQQLLEDENKLTDGFRVQLYATKDIESATIAKKEAQFVFVDDSLSIYIEFDSPYYKLRIGDFKERDKAEAFREIAREKGYPSSWIVKTKVWSNPTIPIIEQN
jgi:hypothetical protein